MDFVHRFEASPTGRDKTTLVLLHGTGGDEDDLMPLGQFLAPDAARLGIRGKIVEGGAKRFFRRIAEGVFDEEDLVFRTHELARFLEAAVKEYALDSHRLVAVGYSNGANIAASMLLLEPDIFSAAILFRAMVPFESDKLPSLGGKKVLMQSGTNDPLILAADSQRLADILQAAGAEVTLNWEETGHGVREQELQTVKAWASKVGIVS